MSFSGQEARSFYGPLMGRTATFLLEGREANLGFARTAMGLLGATADACAILDLDAVYSSNADRILLPLRGRADASTVKVPRPGSNIERELSSLFEAHQEVLIVDSLNSLYHLISLDDGSTRSRKLSFAVASLSYLARTNGKIVILTMYRREGFARSGTSRSISNLSDVTATVEIKGDEMMVRTDRGQAWPGRRFSTRIP